MIVAIFIKVYIIEGVLVLYIKTLTENTDEASHVIQRINLDSYDLIR